MNSKLLKLVGIILVVIMMLNLETVHIALMIDGAGMEVIVFLVQIQLVAAMAIFRNKSISPCLKFILRFRSYSFLYLPGQIFCADLRLAGFVFPGVNSFMRSLVLLIILFSIVKTIV